MVVQRIYNKDAVLGLADTEFAKLDPKPDKALCLPDFEAGKHDQVFRTALAYVRDLLSGPLGDIVASPIFRFVVNEDMDRLSTGGKKWVGIIPREMDPERTQNLAIRAANTLSAAEKRALDLDQGEMLKVRRLIRNTLTAILHYNLNAAEKSESLNVTLYPKGGQKAEYISYAKLEEKFRELNEVFENGREPTAVEQRTLMIQLLKSVGTLEADAKEESCAAAIDLLTRAKSEAWDLLDKLDRNIQLAQRRAKIPGPLAEMDINTDHPSLSLFEHLRAVYGLSTNHGKTVEDRYELQTAADLFWLLARLSNHPIYKTLLSSKDEVERDFANKVFHSGKVFKKNDKRKIIHLDSRGRPCAKTQAHNTWDPEVYDSVLEGFDDISPEQKQIYRSRFRAKEKSSILIKTMRDREDLAHISDALAGEAVMVGINEKDLDEAHSPNAGRLQAFMIAQAEALAASLGLKKAPKAPDTTEENAYRKIPRGTYMIVPKLAPSKNPDSFNFPAVKIYINYPVEDGSGSEEKSIRMEYRFLCQDTWLRANKQTDSMSHHENYKINQGVELLDILTARAYNGNIHVVANKHRRYVKRRKSRELRELRQAA